MIRDTSTSGLLSADPFLERLKWLTETASHHLEETSYNNQEAAACYLQDTALVADLGMAAMDVDEEEGTSRGTVRGALISAPQL